MIVVEIAARGASLRLPNLRAARLARGLSRHDLAIASGVGRSTIRRVEVEGAAASAEVGLRLAAALDAAPEDLQRPAAGLRGVPALRRLRLARGVTEPELAERAGLGLALVLRIERGERAASVAVVARLASALGVTIGELSGDEGETRRSA